MSAVGQRVIAFLRDALGYATSATRRVPGGSPRHLPKGFRAKGEIFVFVDECHRTQSGKLHDTMKTLLPGAMLIGFTSTPLLKSDKRRSIETFGPYIHTYKTTRR